MWNLLAAIEANAKARDIAHIDKEADDFMVVIEAEIERACRLGQFEVRCVVRGTELPNTNHIISSIRHRLDNLGYKSSYNAGELWIGWYIG
jgi:hypothetical protein